MEYTTAAYVILCNQVFQLAIDIYSTANSTVLLACSGPYHGKGCY